jgi:hypothetical protein
MILKSKDCKHQFENDPKCQPAFRNTYRCECGAIWQDIWSCGCDDDCPSCGMTIEAKHSVEIAKCACQYLNHGERP